MEFEKWRDADMYDDIRLATSCLENKIRQFNNFDRYCNELDKGHLTWSVLHSGNKRYAYTLSLIHVSVLIHV